MNFLNKRVIITGAAGALGQAVAKAFSQYNAMIALVDIDEQGLEKSYALLHKKCKIVTITADLFSSKSVQSMSNQVKEQLGGPIHILANIAGGFSMGNLLHETSDQDWELMMGLNARSVFYTCRSFIPQMLDNNSGHIINISARAANEGKSRMGPYSASKAAVITLTQTLANEHKFNNINVNCIMPGTIDTLQNRLDMPNINHKNWVPPRALANVVLFLSSEEAKYITGAAIPVYGKT